MRKTATAVKLKFHRLKLHQAAALFVSGKDFSSGFIFGTDPRENFGRAGQEPRTGQENHHLWNIQMSDADRKAGPQGPTRRRPRSAVPTALLRSTTTQ